MTVAEWAYGVRTHGAEFTVDWAVKHGLDLKTIRCLNSRSSLRLNEKLEVDAELDRRSCCDG